VFSTLFTYKIISASLSTSLTFSDEAIFLVEATFFFFLLAVDVIESGNVIIRKRAAAKKVV
jgi:hypothetical protein